MAYGRGEGVAGRTDSHRVEPADRHRRISVEQIDHVTSATDVVLATAGGADLRVVCQEVRGEPQLGGVDHLRGRSCPVHELRALVPALRVREIVGRGNQCQRGQPVRVIRKQLLPHGAANGCAHVVEGLGEELSGNRIQNTLSEFRHREVMRWSTHTVARQVPADHVRVPG